MKKLLRTLEIGPAILILACAFASTYQQPVSAQSGAGTLLVTFEKSDPDGDNVWNGSVTGDLVGTLRTEPTFVDDSEPVWLVGFDFVISGDKSMTLHLEGTLDTESGAVIMDGTVVEGYMAGATVHEEAWLVDPAMSRYQGRIRIIPAAGTGDTQTFIKVASRRNQGTEGFTSTRGTPYGRQSLER